jgi:hypothetical protein
VRGRGPSWPPVRDRSSENSTESREFSFLQYGGGSQPRYAKAPSSIATGLRRPHLAPKIPPQKNTCGLQNSRNKKQNTRRSFLYSVQERSFLSPSPSEYRFPCIKTSITVQFRFFPVCGPCSKIGAASFSKWHLDSSSARQDRAAFGQHYSLNGCHQTTFI